MLQGAYTFGRAMDDADLAVGSTAFQDAADLGGEWAVAGYDATHKLSIVGLWELPFFQQQRRAVRARCSAAGSWPARRSCRAARR